MIDLVRKNGDRIDLQRLGEALGCRVMEMSALRGEGGAAAEEAPVEEAPKKRVRKTAKKAAEAAEEPKAEEKPKRTRKTTKKAAAEGKEEPKAEE